MKRYAVDTETYLIGLGLLAPSLACVSVAVRDSTALDYTTALLNHVDGVAAFSEILDEAIRGDAIIVGQNFVYDAGVFVAEEPRLLEKVFRAYEVGCIIDCKERQKLIDLADGEMKFTIDEEGNFRASEYSLGALSYRHLGWRLDKSEDSFRLRYGTLRGVPIAEWPPEARRYAVLDAGATLLVSEAQDKTESPVVKRGVAGGVPEGFAVVTDEVHQLRAHWALHLQSLWGFRTDADAVARLRVRLEEERRENLALLHGHAGDCPDGVQCSPFFTVHKFKRGKNAGTVKVTKKQRAVQARVLEGFLAQGLKPPITDKGHEILKERGAEGDVMMLGDDLVKYVATEKEALEDAVPGLPPHPGAGKKTDLGILAQMQYGARLLSSYIPRLENGARFPLRANYNLLLETGRTSCPQPRDSDDGAPYNLQVQPRKPGIRECLIARPGYVICSVDYSQLELCTWAQTLYDLFGPNPVMEAINAGRDLHVLTGAEIRAGRDNAPCSYDDLLSLVKGEKKGQHALRCSHGPHPCGHAWEEHPKNKDTKETRCRVAGCGCDRFVDEFIDAADMRQCAKPANFGYPGMMGPATFTIYARKNYGIRTTFEIANAWREAWRRTFPIYKQYFEWICSVVDVYGTIEMPRSGRVRGGVTPPQAANNLFQGPAADGAKEALWDVAWACYVDKQSPLYGCRPFGFIHDEILTEMPESIAHEAAHEQAKIMKTAMRRWVPDVDVQAEPALMRRLSKAAGDPKVIDGRLVPYEDFLAWEKEQKAA